MRTFWLVFFTVSAISAPCSAFAQELDQYGKTISGEIGEASGRTGQFIAIHNFIAHMDNVQKAGACERSQFTLAQIADCEVFVWDLKGELETIKSKLESANLSELDDTDGPSRTVLDLAPQLSSALEVSLEKGGALLKANGRGQDVACAPMSNADTLFNHAEALVQGGAAHNDPDSFIRGLIVGRVVVADGILKHALCGSFPEDYSVIQRFRDLMSEVDKLSLVAIMERGCERIKTSPAYAEICLSGQVTPQSAYALSRVSQNGGGTAGAAGPVSGAQFLLASAHLTVTTTSSAPAGPVITPIVFGDDEGMVIERGQAGPEVVLDPNGNCYGANCDLIDDPRPQGFPTSGPGTPIVTVDQKNFNDLADAVGSARSGLPTVPPLSLANEVIPQKAVVEGMGQAYRPEIIVPSQVVGSVHSALERLTERFASETEFSLRFQIALPLPPSIATIQQQARDLGHPILDRYTNHNQLLDEVGAKSETKVQQNYEANFRPLMSDWTTWLNGTAGGLSEQVLPSAADVKADLTHMEAVIDKTRVPAGARDQFKFDVAAEYDRRCQWS